jgi:hypothetical protein
MQAAGFFGFIKLAFAAGFFVLGIDDIFFRPATLAGFFRGVRLCCLPIDRLCQFVRSFGQLVHLGFDPLDLLVFNCLLQVVDRTFNRAALLLANFVAIIEGGRR